MIVDLLSQLFQLTFVTSKFNSCKSKLLNQTVFCASTSSVYTISCVGVCPQQAVAGHVGFGLVALDLECIHDHEHGSYAAMNWHETSDQWSWKATLS